jgi:hypothetical protein
MALAHGIALPNVMTVRPYPPIALNALKARYLGKKGSDYFAGLNAKRSENSIPKITSHATSASKIVQGATTLSIVWNVGTVLSKL